MPNMYSPLCFSALPSLGDAKRLFYDTGARQYLEGPIQNLFLDFKVEKRYGVALLHRHFDIQPTKRLVDYHHTSTAWSAPDDTTDVYPKYDGQIVPRSYLFDGDGTLRPFEFAFVSNDSATPIPSSVDEGEAFISAFHSLLCQYCLEKVFGLRDLEGHNPELSVEVTEGFANVMLAPSAICSDNLIEALWTFSSDPEDSDGETTRRCHCREHCFALKDGGHESNHSC